MAGRKRKFPVLPPEKAHAALRWLHATGKIATKDIAGALRDREDLAAEVRMMLDALGGEGLRFLRGPEVLKRPPMKRRRRKPSAKAQAAWRAQGRYMAAVRRLSKADRARVKKIRGAKGVRAAIAAAKRTAAVRRPKARHPNL